MSDLKAILDERGQDYGLFMDQAKIAQGIKKLIHNSMQHRLLATTVQNEKARAAVEEGVDMIASKLSRIANGDPYHLDSWDDIAGYASIVARDIRAAKEEHDRKNVVVAEGLTTGMIRGFTSGDITKGEEK